MRALALTLVSIAALVAGASTIFAQDKKDDLDSRATGQSQRPADPKHAEPESSSHNADSPNPARAKPQDGNQTAAPEQQKDQKKKPN